VPKTADPRKEHLHSSEPSWLVRGGIHSQAQKWLPTGRAIKATHFFITEPPWQQGQHTNTAADGEAVASVLGHRWEFGKNCLGLRETEQRATQTIIIFW